MDVDDWLQALRRDTDAMAEVAERGPLDAPVPACPGWSVADLVYHAGEVLNFWSTVVRDEVRDPEMIDLPVRPADGDLAAWFRTVAAEAVRVLSTSNPADPCWTWSRQNDVVFVIRRMAQELAVHTWDALDAVGRPAAIEAALASDGVDEFLEHFAGWRENDAADLGGTAHLHCTDVPGEWLVRQDGEALAFTREHAKGSCALRGAASELLLVLWRRRPLDSVDVIGDAGVAERFIAWTSLN